VYFFSTFRAQRSTSMNETAVLADYAARTSYEDIPSAVLQRARHTICDTVGAIIFGYDLPWSQMIADYATAYGAGGRSHILGRGAGCVQPPMAALVNGALSLSSSMGRQSRAAGRIHAQRFSQLSSPSHRSVAWEARRRSRHS
jgi:hypothetical protein